MRRPSLDRAMYDLTTRESDKAVTASQASDGFRTC